MKDTIKELTLAIAFTGMTVGIIGTVCVAMVAAMAGYWS